ncbi:MAG: glutamate ligase domain-containing protein, partial [Alphaproteobacteria bacterium]
MEELEALFGAYLGRASRSVVVNAEQPRVMRLCAAYAEVPVVSYGIECDIDVTLRARALQPQTQGIDFTLDYDGRSYDVRLSVAGRYNVENALGALGVCGALGYEIEDSIQALQSFQGIHRRMERVGVTARGVTVLDDFAHNPDKISASLQALKEFSGRLIVMFQPHGFGPLRLMGQEIVESFARYLDRDDILLMPEVYYAGGTVDRSVTAQHIVDDLAKAGVDARWFATRDEVGTFIISHALAGDRVVVMGARDDTLHVFARDLFGRL